MKKQKNSKLWLFISLGLFIIFIASVATVALIWVNSPDIVSISNVESGQGLNSLTLNESADLTDIESIEVNCDIADLSIEPYSGEVASIEYQTKEYSKLNVNSSNGKLTIDAIYRKGQKLDLDFLHTKNIKLIIKLPESYNKEISVHNNVGNLNLKGSFSKAKLLADVGDIIAETDTDYLEADCSVGNATITGNINSSKLTSSVGNINYKPTLSQKGEHVLKSDVGGIKLELEDDSDVTVSAKTSLGEINNNFTFTNVIEDDKKDISSSFLAVNKEGTSTINISCDSGEININ